MDVCFFILREFEGERESRGSFFRRHRREGMLQEMKGARKGSGVAGALMWCVVKSSSSYWTDQANLC